MAVKGRVIAVRSNNPGTLLAAMLQRKESVVSQDGSVRMTKYGENAAFVGRFMVLH